MNHADRTRIHKIAELLIAHHDQLDYPRGDVRGQADADTWKLTLEQAEDRLKRGGRLCFDCSQSTTQIMRWAKVHDPNGLGYKHPGYTGTMLHHLHVHYFNAKQADVGALVVFGPGTGDHVALVIGKDHEHGNPLLFSHGEAHTAGPIRLHAEAQYHRPPVTFLSVAGL